MPGINTAVSIRSALPLSTDRVVYYPLDGHSIDRSVSAITLGNPTVVTDGSANYVQEGDWRYYTGIVGTTQMNGNAYRVSRIISSASYELDLDSTAFTAFVSGTNSAKASVMRREIGNVGAQKYIVQGTQVEQWNQSYMHWSPNGTDNYFSLSIADFRAMFRLDTLVTAREILLIGFRGWQTTSPINTSQYVLNAQCQQNGGYRLRVTANNQLALDYRAQGSGSTTSLFMFFGIGSSGGGPYLPIPAIFCFDGSDGQNCIASLYMGGVIRDIKTLTAATLPSLDGSENILIGATIDTGTVSGFMGASATPFYVTNLWAWRTARNISGKVPLYAQEQKQMPRQIPRSLFVR